MALSFCILLSRSSNLSPVSLRLYSGQVGSKFRASSPPYKKQRAGARCFDRRPSPAVHEDRRPPRHGKRRQADPAEIGRWGEQGRPADVIRRGRNAVDRAEGILLPFDVAAGRREQIANRHGLLEDVQPVVELYPRHTDVSDFIWLRRAAADERGSRCGWRQNESDAHT